MLQVTIGTRDRGWVEILSGLELGAPVITEGVIKIRDGASVTTIVPPNRHRATGHREPDPQEIELMWLSDVSVKRPVFATVISLMLLAFGTLSFNYLPLREYPDISAPVVSIGTSYTGASADVIETRITQVIEDQISGIEGIKNIRSSSRDEFSAINIEFELDRDIDEAANDVRDRVSRVLGRLPQDVDPPIVAKQDSDARPVMYMNVSSSALNMMELHDYVERYIADRFSVIPGVSNVDISGGATSVDAHLARPPGAGRAQSHRRRHRNRACAAKTSNCRPADSKAPTSNCVCACSAPTRRRKISARW